MSKSLRVLTLGLLSNMIAAILKKLYLCWLNKLFGDPIEHGHFIKTRNNDREIQKQI